MMLALNRFFSSVAEPHHFYVAPDLGKKHFAAAVASKFK
jgi:hypothetical protein